MQVPTNLNPTQADLLAQLAQLRGEQVTPPHEGLFTRSDQHSVRDAPDPRTWAAARDAAARRTCRRRSRRRGRRSPAPTAIISNVCGACESASTSPPPTAPALGAATRSTQSSRVVCISRRAVSVQREPELVPSVELAVALTKAGALDTVVARLHRARRGRASRPCAPSLCRPMGCRPGGPGGRTSAQRSAREAAAQSRPARLPEIAPVAELADFAGRPGVLVADRAGRPIDEVAPPAGAAWTVVVGPEGGFAPGELDGFTGAGRLQLGPHILRAETAPIAAVAVLLSRARRVFREWQV